MAVTCGMPAPVTTLVVHIDPGPIPIFDRIGTSVDQELWYHRHVATLPAITANFGYNFLSYENCIQYAL